MAVGTSLPQVITSLVAASRKHADVAFASIVLMLCSWTGLRIGRRKGAMLLAGYALYVFVLWP